jgi:enoyl-CoA hydratase/carnithine racemase
MHMEAVGYELQDGIATISLDDGKVNALSIETLRALHGALDRAEQDGAVTILRGRESCLSAGFDLKVFGEGVEPALEMLTLGATWPSGCFRSRRRSCSRAAATRSQRARSWRCRPTRGSAPTDRFGSA